MCRNANTTAANLMAAIRPTLVNLLTLAGLADTPDGKTALAEFDAALAAVKGWQHGTSAQDVIQLIDDFDQGFNALPVPADYRMLANIIAAGVVTVIGVLTANSPAPPAIATVEDPAAAGHEEVQAHHQAHTIVATADKVRTLVPGYRRAVFTPADKQYRSEWNKAVDAAGAGEKYRV